MASMIVAVDSNNAIGYRNETLIHIPKDMKQFREKTIGHTVIMGRRTYNSLPIKNRPLQDRFNLVVTREQGTQVSLIEQERNLCFTSLEVVKKMLKTKTLQEEVFVIGGAFIYEQLLPYCDKIYLTKIYKTFKEADAFFPTLDGSWFISDESEVFTFEDVDYQFFVYERIQN